MTAVACSIIAADIAHTPVAEAILRLDRKIARGIQSQRGINLKPEELDLLTLVGALELLGAARSEIMKEKAQCRSRRASTAGASSTSTTFAGRMASRQP